MKHPADHGDINPGFADGGISFIVFAETTILAQPSESTFNNPALGQHDKGFQFATAHNFSDNAEKGLTPVQQGWTIIAAVEQHFAPTRIEGNAFEQVPCAITLGPVGWMHQGLYHPALTVNRNMAFSSLHLFATIVAAWPPFSVVLTDWLSTMSKLGSASRSSWTRTCSRSAALIRSHVPSRFSL